VENIAISFRSYANLYFSLMFSKHTLLFVKAKLGNVYV
jgi:hypothetical protein